MARFHLVTLGRLALVDSSGTEDELGKRRRKLALLALLALSKRPLSRDALVDFFWGEEPELRARHSLSSALSHLRQVLGKEAILSGRADVALTADASLTVDALELSAAADGGDHERVVALYGGPFLDGMYVPGSVRFDEWADRERSRLERAFVASCAHVCAAASRQERWVHCASVAARWLDARADSAEAAKYIEAAHEAKMAAAPAGELMIAPAPVSTPILDETLIPAVSRAAGRTRSSIARRIWSVAAVAVVGIATLVAGIRFGSGRGPSSADAREAVAIVNVAISPNDSSIVWLKSGFPLMIAASLTRTASLEVVPAGRVHALLARGNRDADSLDDAGDADVATRLGARWAVTANLSRVDGGYVVRLAVHDARGGAIRTFTLAGANILTVADQSAARVRQVTNADSPGARLADVETSNVVAFEHFVRANQAGDEGRFVDQLKEIDAAVAADSGFTSALVARMRIARYYVDTATVSRLAQAYTRASSRITRWDQLEQAQYLAMHNGEHARAEQLARELVQAYPHDPRAYQTLATTLSLHGQWSAADSVLRSALRLDSLAIDVGHGPCVPCATYAGLIDNDATIGHLSEAEHSARLWLALQPDLPAAWASLATVLAYAGRFDAALDAERHAAQLAGEDAEYQVRIGRILVMARRLSAVDSLIHRWRTSAGPAKEYLIGALDLESVIERERGQYRASERTLQKMSVDFHDGGLDLVRANSAARAGRFDDARHMYERFTQHGDPGESASPVQSLAGDRARTFAWHHALEADAIAPMKDTLMLRALADSIEQIGARSYYARDWRLHHHVRGLIALIGGRANEASREFASAEFGAAGWTRTNALLAESRLDMRDPTGAIAALRAAYQSPPDAMGRYLSRSELDYWMARALSAGGLADSARLYAGYAAAAWAAPDIEIAPRRREMLQLLDQRLR